MDGWVTYGRRAVNLGPVRWVEYTGARSPAESESGRAIAASLRLVYAGDEAEHWIHGPDATAAWDAIRGLAAPPAGAAAADQLGPAVLAAIAELRRLADACTPGGAFRRDLSALADRLVGAACEAAAAAGEPAGN